MRGPESTFHVPYKVIIRVQQLVLFAQASIGWHHCRTRNPIGPRNWSTVMWPAPIGWWRRVSPAIYTTRTQDLGSVSRSLVFGHFGEHTLVYRRYGTLLVAAPAVRRSLVQRAHPTTFHSVYCLGVSPTSSGGLECPVVCDTYVLCTENI